MRRSRAGLMFYIILIAIVCFGVYIWSSGVNRQQNTYTNNAFEKDLQEGDVNRITVSQNQEVPTGVFYVYTTGTSYKALFVPDVNAAIEKVQEKYPDVEISVSDVDRPGLLATILPYIIVLVVCILLFMLMSSQAASGGSNGKMMNFGKSRAQMIKAEDIDTDFSKVAGLTEEKEDVAEIVDFLKNPKQFTDAGARIPKGVLFEGPPGTGKTLLAKAIAGEAHVPFFSISGSDFVEMFVGVGASRVRDLFAEAKKNTPCIIFIDEIDAVARRRGSGLGGGHDEREQTLNQMLVEMDGFSANQGIVVIAATNRVDILDPAILRPGRFDRKIAISKPDVKGREEILKVHTANKSLAEDVNLHEIARTTAGFAGADLENLMNESAIIAAKDKRIYIKKADVDKAFVKIGIGTEKRSRLVPEHERKITAYHETGHAILFHVLPDMGPVYAVSIIPTGPSAGGYTMPLPENDNEYMTKGKLLQEIEVSLGGRIAEELIFDDITTGASQDIKEATRYARAMVIKFGMSDELGLINYETQEGDEVFLGRDLGHERPYSESTAKKIDKEVKRIMDDCYGKAKAIVMEHMDFLHACAKLLLEKERINQHEFEDLFNQVEGNKTGDTPALPEDGVLSPE